MPLTTFQRRVLELLIRNRSEDSHFAGGIALNVADDSPRYSRDSDLFHDAVDDLVRASEQDVRTLEAAGLTVKKIDRDGSWEKSVSFRQAVVRGAEGEVALDWAHDSAFRFFPKQTDLPIGVAFVDERGEPGWIRRNPALRLHPPSLRGCFPTVADQA